MKKLLIIALTTLLFSACTKSSTNGNTTVEYQYTGSASGTYQIIYIDANNNPVTVNFTGTTWSKTISTNQAMGFKWAQLTINGEFMQPIAGDGKIYINGVVKNDQAYTFDQQQGLETLSMRYILF